MNEDYLWDKTGEDAEIERLESVLSVFKYEQSAAPRPAVVVLPERKRGWAVSLRLAFASGFAAVFIAGAAFVLWPGAEIATVGEIPSPQFPATAEQSSASGPERAAIPTTVVPAKQITAERFAVKHSMPPRPIRKTATKRRPVPQHNPGLTAEEKYAYNQLMLALAITGSKLQIVKDAVNGTDVAKAAPDTSTK